MNVLWIMCDQLRYDYLGCTGHPTIKTPNIDALAKDGVLFSQAYVQSPICGPSRMSAYTGRYVRSHGSTTNDSPLRVGEPTLGDHLTELGIDAVLIGKTHMTADVEGMRRLGIEQDSVIGVRTAECGFRPFDREEGLYPDGDQPDSDYIAYLRAEGYEADNPWETYVNAAENEHGEMVSGWFMRHATKPSRVPAHLSETAYLTDRVLEFIETADRSRPWVAHASYIKPHWPYIAADPYHSLYEPDDVIAPQRSGEELAKPHKIMDAFRQERVAKAFAREEVRDTVIPTYMGLISEVDDHVGRIIGHLKESGQYDDTLIIFSSDHGDYLGDHWLGEKQLFHDPSVRIPFIVRDPRTEAAQTRGNVSDALVEMIDVVPTLLDLYGADTKDHVLEGRSLLPALSGNPEDWRHYVFSEYHYADDNAMWRVGLPPQECMVRMVANQRWKLMQFENASPLLFDKQTDPFELDNLADHAEFQDVLDELHEALFKWARSPRNNICTPNQAFNDYAELARHYDQTGMLGYKIGYWDEAEFEEEERKRRAFIDGQASDG